MRIYYTEKGIVNLPKKKRLRNKVLKRVICISDDPLPRDNFFLVNYYDGIIKGVDTSGFANGDILSLDCDNNFKKLNVLYEGS